MGVGNEDRGRQLSPCPHRPATPHHHLHDNTARRPLLILAGTLLVASVPYENEAALVNGCGGASISKRILLVLGPTLCY